MEIRSPEFILCLAIAVATLGALPVSSQTAHEKQMERQERQADISSVRQEMAQERERKQREAAAPRQPPPFTTILFSPQEPGWQESLIELHTVFRQSEELQVAISAANSTHLVTDRHLIGSATITPAHWEAYSEAMKSVPEAIRARVRAICETALKKPEAAGFERYFWKYLLDGAS